MVDTKEGEKVKLIHCADVHLHSRLNTHLSVQQSKERNGELVSSFVNMVEYGHRHGVSAVLIAGDLFDGASVPQSLQNTLIHIMKEYSEMMFFYLRGNHDENSVLAGTWEEAGNLYCFQPDTWTSFSIPLSNGNLTITGMELTQHSSLNGLQLSSDDINIVMLHGQIRNYGKPDGMNIPLKQLEDHNIDYLALGHIHSYEQGILRPDGTWCYAGSMEGRGFDEPGEHGFVMLEVDEENRTVHSSFIPFATRTVHVIDVDVSDCCTSVQMMQKAKMMITGDMQNDMVRIRLCGDLDVSVEKDITTIEKMLENKCWYLEVKDETRLFVDYEQYAKDASLKGEFVRLVYGNDTYTSVEKAEIIQCGIAALNGEEQV